MKFVPNRPYSVSERAARQFVEIANSVEAVQDGWIYIELINGPFLYRERGTPEEYKGRPRSSDRARSWLWMHESRTYVKFAQASQTCSPNWDVAVAVSQAVPSNP